jgi:hypothetical protein
MSTKKTRGTRVANEDTGEWPRGIFGWEWPVRWGYEITYADGCTAYYPSWAKIPHRILLQQERGGYDDADVTVVTWDESHNP